MTPLVAVALAGWAIILVGGALYAARAVVRDRRAGRQWRAGEAAIAGWDAAMRAMDDRMDEVDTSRWDDDGDADL